MTIEYSVYPALPDLVLTGKEPGGLGNLNKPGDPHIAAYLQRIVT